MHYTNVIWNWMWIWMQILQAVLAEARMLQWGGKNENLPLMKSPPADNQKVPAQDQETLAQGSQKNTEIVHTDWSRNALVLVVDNTYFQCLLGWLSLTIFRQRFLLSFLDILAHSIITLHTPGNLMKQNFMIYSTPYDIIIYKELTEAVVWFVSTLDWPYLLQGWNSN